jgi:lipoate-protein ligase B
MTKPKFYGWQIFLGGRRYKAALEWQKRMARYRENGIIRDTLFYMEHPDVVTIGRDYPDEDMSNLKGIEWHYITRGGGYTYHGPGQLVVYPIFDLRRRGKDLHKFIDDLEEGIIRTFAEYDLGCRRRKGHTGVWIKNRKIASIGVAVKRWISFHGAAINLTTDLKKFKVINPCGLPPETMTNAHAELKKKIPLKAFAGKLSEAYSEVFDTRFDDVDLDELAEMVQSEESSQSL